MDIAQELKKALASAYSLPKDELYSYAAIIVGCILIIASVAVW